MKYPTMEQVEAADRVQLCRWWRFLPSPGMSYLNQHRDGELDRDAAEESRAREAKIQSRAMQRFHEAGGFTVEISKQIGWDNR